MKSIKYLKLALFALVIGLSATSCMDEDWTDPTGEVAPFGNNQLQETNVVSIADLKAKYGAQLKDVVNDTVRIADGVQIKGRVTGNDISGNIYSQVMIEDATGGIIISVAQGVSTASCRLVRRFSLTSADSTMAYIAHNHSWVSRTPTSRRTRLTRAASAVQNGRHASRFSASPTLRSWYLTCSRLLKSAHSTMRSLHRSTLDRL